MAGEGQETPVAQDTGEDAAFDTGFGHEPQQTNTPAVTVEEKPAEEVAPPPAAETPVEYVQLTKAEVEELRQGKTAIEKIKAEYKQRFDNLGGTLGGLKQQVQEVLAARRDGTPVDIMDDDYAELRSEFPELAALVEKGQKRILERNRVGGAPDPAAIEKLVNERLAPLHSQQIDVSLDAVVGGDWKAEVASEQFGEWLNGQPDDIKALSESSNVRDAARMLRLYQVAKSAPPPVEPKAPASAPAAPTFTAAMRRRSQLAAAVNPRGVPALPQATTDDDAFDDGFKGR